MNINLYQEQGKKSQGVIREISNVNNELFFFHPPFRKSSIYIKISLPFEEERCIRLFHRFAFI